MLKVKDIMTRSVITTHPDAEIAEAARLLFENDINGVPVVDASQKLVGILCQSDLISLQKRFPVPSLFTFLDGLISFTSMTQLKKEVEKMAATTVAQAMTPSPVFVGPEASIEEVATLMVEKKFHTLPVVDQSRLVGIVGKKDILKCLMADSIK